MRAHLFLLTLLVASLLAACGTEDADLNPPVFTLSGPSSALLNRPSNAAPVELTGTLDDPAATVEVEINGNAAPAGAFSLSSDGNWTLSFTPIEGTNTVSLTASDARGNINQLAFSLVHDIVAPTVVSVTQSTTDPATQLVVVFSEKLDKASAEALTAYGIAGATITAATLDSEATALTVTLTLSQALAPGTHTLTAAGIKDLSLPDGNATAAGYTFEFTLP